MYFDWLDDRIQRVKETCESLRLEIRIDLNPPIPLDEVRKLEDNLGIKLANSQRAFYQKTNGLEIDFRCVIELETDVFSRVGSQMLIPQLSEIKSRISDYQIFRDEWAESDNLMPQDYWKNLLLCCDIGDSNYILLDPENESKDGEYRVLYAAHEMTPSIWRRDLVIADSFEEWLQKCFDSIIDKKETPEYWSSDPLIPEGAEKYDWRMIDESSDTENIS